MEHAEALASWVDRHMYPKKVNRARVKRQQIMRKQNSDWVN